MQSLPMAVVAGAGPQLTSLLDLLNKLAAEPSARYHADQEESR
jgi:hypothetical protein